jgi:hypothetical protein
MKIFNALLCCCLATVLHAGPFGFDLDSNGESCAGLGDGAVRLTLTGGNVPINFQWLGVGSSGNGSLTISNPIIVIDQLTSGTYTFLFVDVVGRDTVIQVVITAPQGIETSILKQGDLCFGQNEGVIAILDVVGGVPPFQFKFNNAAPVSTAFWDNLPPGNYFLTIIDAIGCKKEEAVVLPAGQEFLLSLGQDTMIFSGDTLQLSVQSNQTLSQLNWTPANAVLNNPDGTVLFFPESSTEFSLEAMDTDGCLSYDKIYIQVKRKRDFYAPNVFKPVSQLLENQTFTLFSSGGIKEIEVLQVFDRVGRLWFEKRQFQINDPTAGWDGSLEGDEAPSGVYLWQAIIRYTDGRTETQIGDVTLIR